MTAVPEAEAGAGPVDGEEESVVSETARADGVLAGRAMSSAVFLAGLLADAQLETAGRPDKLPQDLFPHVDPKVVKAVWDRALAVGLHAGRVMSSPRLYRDQMLRVQGELEAVGFAAMGRMVGRSRRLVVPHPADGEAGREHPTGVIYRTSDTGEDGWDR